MHRMLAGAAADFQDGPSIAEMFAQDSEDGLTIPLGRGRKRFRSEHVKANRDSGARSHDPAYLAFPGAFTAGLRAGALAVVGAAVGLRGTVPPLTTVSGT